MAKLRTPFRPLRDNLRNFSISASVRKFFARSSTVFSFLILIAFNHQLIRRRPNFVSVFLYFSAKMLRANKTDAGHQRKKSTPRQVPKSKECRIAPL